MAPGRESTGSKRKPGGPSSASQEADGPASKRRKLPDTDQEELVEHATKIGYAVLERLRNARDKKNWAVATHFLTLPERKTIPDYYEQIGLPIALDTIEGKVDRREYADVSALESDLKRMITNAKSYNEKTSQVYGDAEKIRKIVSVFMEHNNPAYKKAGYQPTATAVPDKAHENVKDGSVAPTSGDATSAGRSSRRSGRNPAESPALSKENRRASSTPAVKNAEHAGESFEGDTFQQAQEKIITEMMNLTDDENNLISANFLHLPSRTLQDYYRAIKRPVSLKSIAKLVQGIKGRDPPPVPPATLLKGWDAFEHEVGYIWRNAREYNEDGSAIVELAEELREYFEKRLTEAKQHVTEPPQPKVKLTMKAAQEPPKITLKFGQRSSTAAGVSVDQEALARQQNLVRGAANGQSTNGVTQPAARNQLSGSLPPGRGSQERFSAGPGEHGVNGIKREVSHGHSPAPGKGLPNGVGGVGSSVMPPPVGQAPQNPYGSPHPAATNGTIYGGPSHTAAPVPKNPAHLRPEGKDASDAVITNLNICTHPDLRDLPQRFNLDIPASATKTQQSITISLSRRQWRLLIRPTLSASLLQRPSRTFVTCNNRRIQALAQPELDQRRPIFEHKLIPGTNTIEVEVIAGMPRGTPKTGSGQEIEIEKFIVFAHYQQ